MALRKLDNEKKEFINKQVIELSNLHDEAVAKDGEAYSYDWRQLSWKLQDVIQLYKIIVSKR